MARNPNGSFSARKWRQLTGGWVSAEDAVPAAGLTLEMQQASVPSFSFFLMLGLAAAIATFGLLANSAPAIIGAMIIAPLMNPIMSLSYGLVVFKRGLIIRSIVSVIATVKLRNLLLGVTASALLGAPFAALQAQDKAQFFPMLV